MENIYQKITDCEQTGKIAAACIIIKTNGSTPRKAGSKMIVYPDGATIGSVGGGSLELQVIRDAQKVIENGQPASFDHNLTRDHKMSCGGTVQIFIEPVGIKFRLYIFGAGHIGSKLAEMAQRFDFLITLIDERPEIISQIQLDGIKKINKNHKDAFAELVFDERTFIASLSHLHEYDREIVAYCAKQPRAYLGMIGSNRKIAKARLLFTEKKLLSEKELETIDWPMGIPIECQTPDEIVISILAKIIDVRGKLIN